MSIKGNFQELYVGKSESNILHFFGKKEKIVYSELSNITYAYVKFGVGGGYLDFTYQNGDLIRFDFPYKANEKIKRTIELIQENNPELEIIEDDLSNYKIYQKDGFITFLLFICCMPLGLFLIWYYKKYNKPIRIMLTSFFITIWSVGIFSSYVRYATALQDTKTIYYDLFQSDYDESSISTQTDINSSLDYEYPDNNTERMQYEPGEVFESEDLKIMFIDCGDYPVDNEYLKPSTGNKYIYAEFSIYNESDTDYAVGSVSFKCYADNTDCSQAIISDENNMTSITTLSPDRNVKGKIIYEVPENSNSIELEFETDILSQKKIYFIIK